MPIGDMNAYKPIKSLLFTSDSNVYRSLAY